MRDYYFERSENRRYDRTHSNRRVINPYKYILMLLIFIFISLIFIVIINRSTYAKDTSNCRNKLYKSITIYAGDSIDSIADNYESCGYSDQKQFVKELCHINNINESSNLIAGNFIIIPYYEDITI